MAATVPNSLSDITEQWFSTILNLRILPNTFQLIENNKLDEKGFLSEMTRVEFKTCEGSQEHQWQLICKLLPTEPESRKLVLLDHFDKIEINAYQKLFPEFVKVLPELEEYLCPLVYSKIQQENLTEQIPYSSVLIMHDLTPRAFFMIKFDGNFGLFGDNDSAVPPYFSKGLDFLAKFHAASDILEKNRGAKLPELFDWFPRTLEPIEQCKGQRKVPELHNWIRLGFPAVYKILEENPRTTPEMTAAYKKLEPKTPEIFQKILMAGQNYPSALHGDLWTHNILVKGEAASKIDMKIIDWQMLAYGDPAFDLSIYIVENLHLPDLSKENILKAVELYYANYERLLLVKSGLKAKRSAAEFLKFFTTHGLAYCLFWLILGTPDIAKIPSFIPKTYRIFELMMEFGVLEFLLKLTK